MHQKEEGRKKGGTNKVNQKKSTPTVIQRNLTVKLVWQLGEKLKQF